MSNKIGRAQTKAANLLRKGRAESDSDSAQDPVRKSLVDNLRRWGSESNQPIAEIPELKLHMYPATSNLTSYTLEPSICLIAQGAKRVMIGEDIYVYDAENFLITSVDLPVVGQIIEASNEKPYLALTLKLDLRLVAQMMAENKLSVHRTEPANRGILVTKVSPPLLNAFQRLIELLNEPGNILYLAPLILREIHYRILVGDQGQRLRTIAAAGSRSNQISQAIDWLKVNLNQRLRVDELAEQIGMSGSSLHQHFQAITAISPLQFQKRLRLNEARKLMLTERMDAASAAFRVGYESASQFNREYRRQFGLPPLQDIKKIQETIST